MKVPYGDGGQRLLKKRISAHSNASEYMPLLLLLIALLEAGEGTSAGILHLYGLLTFVGRVLHAYTVALDGTSIRGRVIGMILTVSSLTFTSAHLLCKALYAQLQ
ncbi:g6290 [Coccomyxa viridis]|uniref:G6290 protein n=1 Tax=Coccomyxa viridis TaxID=1274662 RepID=A0ABP1FXI6_9CHLO